MTDRKVCFGIRTKQPIYKERVRQSDTGGEDERFKDC